MTELKIHYYSSPSCDGEQTNMVRYVTCKKCLKYLSKKLAQDLKVVNEKLKA